MLIIHGGAGSKNPTGQRRIEIENSLERVIGKVTPKLLKGMSAVDAVVLAVQMLEDDPLYNAGLGSKIQSDGKIRMSAALMDGYRQKFSGCINVQNLKNPIVLAKELNSFKYRVLAEGGAEDYAASLGLPKRSPMTRAAKKLFIKQKKKFARKGKFGTVGAVALDKEGRIAAATSTGGRGFEYPHRVSDSPTVAGNFANRECGVSATGYGEQIVDAAVAASICSLVKNGVDLKTVSQKILREAVKNRAQFGFIALNRKGDYEVRTSTAHMIWAVGCKDHHTISP
jgi:L-asparaginase